jgi:hypothetical protein
MESRRVARQRCRRTAGREPLHLGGFGTMVFAGRLVQAGQGRIISINGHR